MGWVRHFMAPWSAARAAQNNGPMQAKYATNATAHTPRLVGCGRWCYISLGAREFDVHRTNGRNKCPLCKGSATLGVALSGAIYFRSFTSAPSGGTEGVG